VFGLCCYTSDTGQAEVAIWSIVRGLSQNHKNGGRHRAWTFCPFRETPGTCHIKKMGSPTLVLITHIATEIMLIAILNQGCERPSSGFECHLTADVAECIRWIYALSCHINGGTNTTYFWDYNTPSSGQQPARGLLVTRVWRVTVGLLHHVQTTSYRLPVTPLCVRVRSHSLTQRKRYGYREILETYSNSASKNTSEAFFLMSQNHCFLHHA